MGGGDNSDVRIGDTTVSLEGRVASSRRGLAVHTIVHYRDFSNPDSDGLGVWHWNSDTPFIAAHRSVSSEAVYDPAARAVQRDSVCASTDK